MTHDKIRYLSACYQADFRAVSLLNFFSKKVETPLMFAAADLLMAGQPVLHPVPMEWALEVKSRMAVYAKEKSLYCCAVFLAGSTNIAGKEETVMAPVYLYPAELAKVDGKYYVAIDEHGLVINPAIITAEINADSGKYEALSASLPKGFFTPKKIKEIQQVLADSFPSWDTSLLELMPNLTQMDGAKTLLKKAQKAQKSSFIPAIGLCLIDKPTGSRGILNELNDMVGHHLSQPIHELLDKNWGFPYIKPYPASHVPALLSERQAGILANAGRLPLQVVVGPPGTGKSFTIAALAIEMLSRGKSVLIASKNDEACNVVADKIERNLDIPGVVVRASRSDYKINLQKRLENLLNGIDVEVTEKKELTALTKRQELLHQTIQKLEAKVEKMQEDRLVDGIFLHQYDGGLVQKIQKTWVKWRHDNLVPLWKLSRQLESLLHEHHNLLRSYIKMVFNFQLNKALVSSRLELQNMVNAAKARTGTRKDSFFGATDFKLILRTLPIWTVNTADVHRVLPLGLQMFDLVIIDEATQCDIASCLPILQRGKSALVVGDPKQLRHLSFLSNQQQQALANKHNLPVDEMERLNYRDNSLLDLVLMSLPSQERVHFLDEHYRSMPDIIAFSNAQFYNNRLHVMTATPATQGRQHVFIEKIGGKRLAQGHNPLEADYALREIQQIIESEAAMDAAACQTIGFISPIREQVNYFQKKLEDTFTVEQMNRHRLMVGTPFAFQGEERDVVFLSFVLDNESHPSAFQYLNREDVFNVSITRARSHQKLLVSFDPQKLQATSLTKQYLTHLETNQNTPPSLPKLHPPHAFVESVRYFLIEIGVEQLHLAYPIAGVQLDFVVVVHGKTYGIDLIGHPDHWGHSLSLNDWKMLYRTGVPLFYLPYSEWYLDEEKVKRGLRWFLQC
jgi:hypothetical protein